MDNKFCASEIFDFFRDFKAVKADGKYINITTDSSFISALVELSCLPLRNYYLSELQIKKILAFSF